LKEADLHGKVMVMNEPPAMDPARNHFLAMLKAHLPEVQGFGVSRIGLFGSCLRGEARPDSDVDVLVEFRPGAATLANLVGLGDFLEGLFGRPVDVVTPEALSPYIGPHILSEVRYAEGAA